MYYLDPKIKRLHRIFDQNERKGYLRLDLNENPGGLPQELVNKVLDGISPQLVAQYPETLGFTKLLANVLDTDINHLCIVNGSAEGIRYIIQAFTAVTGLIVGVTPSYAMYQVYAEMYGRRYVTVPYHEDLSMDVNSIISEMTDDTQLLILQNPNNPVGNVYSEEEFERIFNAASAKQITILIDEAYHYYYPESCMRYALEEKHVFVTRSFSKFFSMAGCRIGFVAGWSEGIEMVQKLCTPHNVNVFALRFAESVISTPGLIDELLTNYISGRQYLISWLDAHSYVYKGEAGNFIFIRPKTDADIIVNRMKTEKMILIKSYPNMGILGNCLRVTIGEKKYMEIFVNALFEIDK